MNVDVMIAPSPPVDKIDYNYRRFGRRTGMLARTADNLFWLARYMERADYVARIVDTASRMATLPKAYGGEGTEWASALESIGCSAQFHRFHSRIQEADVIEFLVFAEDNPSSIKNCIEAARANARAVRTALTTEMWDAINSGWLELKRIEGKRFGRSGLDREEFRLFLEFVKEISLRFDGSAYRTMLRDDAYWYSRLGLYIERADNTARLLDVKYHVLLPETETVGGSLDYYQWAAILRAVSAVTAYHWVYRQSVKPWLIADLLILRSEFPRSLVSCYENLVRMLDAIAQSYGRQGMSQRAGRTLLAKLENSTMTQIFQSGLHEFIADFLAENNAVGEKICQQYLF